MIETPSIDSIERVVSVADTLPYYFLLANTAALLIEGPLQLSYTQHTTAQHKAIISTPNPTTAQLADGKRSNDGCQPGTLCGHGELCSDTLVERFSSLSCYYVLLQDYTSFLDNMYVFFLFVSFESFLISDFYRFFPFSISFVAPLSPVVFFVVVLSYPVR